jgi:hypothetical protein
MNGALVETCTIRAMAALLPGRTSAGAWIEIKIPLCLPFWNCYPLPDPTVLGRILTGF